VTWTKEIEEALDRAEVVIALLTAGSYASEICRAEQLRALRHGKVVIPIRAQAAGASRARYQKILDQVETSSYD
jgi:hypothetical protein